MNGGVDPIRFLLSMRSSDDGCAQILLRLYQGGQPVSETVISTVKETKARMILLMSRMQLFRLGYEEHVPVMPRAMPLQLANA